MIWQLPKPHRAAKVGFYYSRAPIERLEPCFITFCQPINIWSFEDGSNISMVVGAIGFDPAMSGSMGRPVEMVPLTDSGEIGPEHLGNGLTAMMWNKPGPGIPLQITEMGGVSLQPFQAQPSV